MSKIKIYIFYIFMLLIPSFTFISCHLEKRMTYINNSEEKNIKRDTVFSYKTKPIKYKVNKHDVLMIRFASTNKEVTEFFDDYSGITENSNQYQNYNLMGFTVDDSGYVEIPIIGRYKALGLTIHELEIALQKEADKYLINSRIIVRLLNFNITFIGEIRKQGVLNVQEDQINLLEALAQMGGISDYGNRENILIMRKTETGFKTYRVDATDSKLLEIKEFYLFPNDMVIVEPRKYKVITSNLREYSTLLVSVSSILTTITLLFSVFNGK